MGEPEEPEEVVTPAADGSRLFRLSIAHGLLALTIVATCPLLGLLVLPLIFGVAHVLGDVRWLLVREAGLSRAWPAILAPLWLMTALRVLWLAGHAWDPQVEMFLGATAVVTGALSAAGSPSRTLLCVTLGVAGGWLAIQHPQGAAVAFAHGHNVVALAFFLFWSHRVLGPARAATLAGSLAAVMALLFSGLVPVRDGPPVVGFDLPSATAALAPGAGEIVGRGAVLSFVLLQALHYSVWLHLVPVARGGRGASEDLGAQWLAVGAALAIAVALAGVADPARTRGAYLAVATFHGWLELAVAAHLISGSRS